MLPITRATAEKFCRSCLQELNLSNNEREPNHDLQLEVELYRWFQVATDLQHPMSYEADKPIYPKLLCHTCYTKTRIFYEFRDKSVCVFIALKEIIDENEKNTELLNNMKIYCITCLKRINERFRNLQEDAEVNSWLCLCTGVNLSTAAVANKCMPSNICNRCYKKLRNFVEYRRVAHESLDYLKSILGTLDDLSQAETNDPPLAHEKTNIILTDDITNGNSVILHCKSLGEKEYDLEPEEDPLNEVCNGDLSDVGNRLSGKENLLIDSKNDIGERFEVRDFSNYDDSSMGDDDKAAEECKSFSFLQQLPEEITMPTTIKFDEEKSTLQRNKVMKCEKCEKRFRKRIMYDAHYRSVHEGIERPFVCEKCSKSFRIYAVMRRHMLECHPQDVVQVKQKWSCSSCAMTFETEDHLNEHYARKHYSLRHYKCDYCLRTFKRRDHLADHVNAVHHGIRSFQCSYCDKKFAARKTLRVHEMGHTGERPFTCDYCHKTFRQMSDLKIHQEKHTTDPNLLCPICYRAKPSFEELQIHVAQHNSNGFQCTKCGKTFKKRSHLNDHDSAVHLRLRPFKCSFCEMSFAARKTLINHELIHTDQWPVTCQICKKGFRASTNLRKHMRTHSSTKKSTKLKNITDIIPATEVLPTPLS